MAQTKRLEADIAAAEAAVGDLQGAMRCAEAEMAALAAEAARLEAAAAARCASADAAAAYVGQTAFCEELGGLLELLGGAALVGVEEDALRLAVSVQVRRGRNYSSE